jgi:TIGR03009 family protein
MLKPVFAGLAISSLCLAFAVDLQAQSGTKSATKKKAAIQPVQAEEDDPEPPRAPPRNRRTVDDDTDAAGAPAAPPSKGGKSKRPPSLDPVRVENVTAEVEKVLKDWERHTAQIQSMGGDISVFQYDHTFEVEKRGEGKFIYGAPDRGVYELRGNPPANGEVSKKKNRNGVPYTIKAVEAQRWFCDGKEITRINDSEKSYEKFAIPPESQGQNIMDGPLPFLFGMKAEKAKQRYRDFKLLRNDGTEIKLELKSKLEMDSRNWDKATLLIDAKTFTPTAVKLTDAVGAETVHVFKNVVVNERRNLFSGNPFKPNLFRYKQVIPPGTAKNSTSRSGKSAGTDDVPDIDLGRTADSDGGTAPRKKAATKTK